MSRFMCCWRDKVICVMYRTIRFNVPPIPRFSSKFKNLVSTTNVHSVYVRVLRAEKLPNKISDVYDCVVKSGRWYAFGVSEESRFYSSTEEFYRYANNDRIITQWKRQRLYIENRGYLKKKKDWKQKSA